MTHARARGLRGAGTLAALLVLGPALVAAGVGNGRPRPAPPPSAFAPSASTPTFSPEGPGHGVVSGRVTIAAVTLDLALSQRAARAGQPVQARATLVNRTAGSLSTVTVLLEGPHVGVVVRPAAERWIRRLPAGGSETVAWIVCSSVPGTYALVAEASVNGATVMSAPRLLTINTAGIC